jgi:hypothetical protein
MNRWRVGKDRGSKETDGCPLTVTRYLWVNRQHNNPCVTRDGCYHTPRDSTGAYSLSCVVYLLGPFTGFLYYGVSTLRDYSHFMCTKGMRRWA